MSREYAQQLQKLIEGSDEWPLPSERSVSEQIRRYAALRESTRRSCAR